MTCFHPLTAYRSKSPLLQIPGTGISFDPRYSGSPHIEELKLPCGQCIGCRIARSKDWALRICLEQSLWQQSCFVTLTYDNEHLPLFGALKQEDMTLFLKRLRKELSPKKIRYFYCGEYGGRTQRPHYHLVLFNEDFSSMMVKEGDGYCVRPDKRFYKFSPCGERLWISERLNRIWQKGYCVIGSLSFDSAAYVARYILKKITGPAAEQHYNGNPSEFVCMSRRPGIGKVWFDNFKGDIYNKDFLTIKNGLKCRPPRYFDKLFSASHADEDSMLSWLQMKDKRKVCLNELDVTPERLAQREEVTKLKYAKKGRSFENEF